MAKIDHIDPKKLQNILDEHVKIFNVIVTFLNEEVLTGRQSIELNKRLSEIFNKKDHYQDFMEAIKDI